MTKPNTLEIMSYAKEISLHDQEVEAFFDYQESKGWKVGRSPMKDWRAALRTWKRNSVKFLPKYSAQSKISALSTEDQFYRVYINDIFTELLDCGETNWDRYRALFQIASKEAPDLKAVIAYCATRMSAEQIAKLDYQ